MNCVSCGAAHDDDARFCTTCGKSIEPEPTGPDAAATQRLHVFAGSEDGKDRGPVRSQPTAKLVSPAPGARHRKRESERDRESDRTRQFPAGTPGSSPQSSAPRSRLLVPALVVLGLAVAGAVGWWLGQSPDDGPEISRLARAEELHRNRDFGALLTLLDQEGRPGVEPLPAELVETWRAEALHARVLAGDLSRLDDATSAVAALARRRPREVVLRRRLGELLVAQGRHGEAAVAFEAGLELGAGEDEAVLRHDAAVAWAAVGDHERAEVLLEQALSLDEGDARSWANRGLLRLRRGGAAEAEGAEADLRKALELEPSPAARAGLAWALFLQGRLTEARVEAESVLLEEPQQLAAASLMARLEQAAGRHELATKWETDVARWREERGSTAGGAREKSAPQ
ncbi:MAG: tetratricopeptide repeat protein [Acidobacteriota bacterium]